jgi:hypothetical protein
MATWPLLVVGFGHALATIPDFLGAGVFSPTALGTRDAMDRSGIVLTEIFRAHRVSLWRGYLGFHVSHGIGLGFFALINLLLARQYPEMLYQSAWLLPVALAMSATYLALSLVCWFYVPTILTTWSSTCLLFALIQSRSDRDRSFGR